MPFFIWLRYLTGQRLIQIHRLHLGAQKRDAEREVSLDQDGLPMVRSGVLAAQLVGRLTSPSVAAQKAEMRRRLQELLDAMEPIDREILTLRHFEQLTNLEAAQSLGLSPTAANNRYVRALERLRSALADRPEAE
jgi:RNA polymerase sigma-70 factor (ECF subfamily)